jgi:hypothetical protein
MNHKEQAWQILEAALQQSTQPDQERPDDHEALLATVVEQYIEDEGISLFVTYPGLHEVLSLIFAAEIQEARQREEEEQGMDSTNNTMEENVYDG